MCSYNRINGVYASQHRWLLTHVLRTEWGFDGVVVSDWGAVHDRVAALAAGLDLEMPPNHGVSEHAIVAAVHTGALNESTLDEAALRVLTLVDRATSITAAGRPADVDAHHALARVAATECAVLLKNEQAALPLRVQDGDVIAVVGEFARTPRYQGAGSSKVNATRVDVPLAEIRAGAPPGVTVAFAAGFEVEPGDLDETLAADAVALATRATVVIAFLGLPPAAESEGFDRTHIDLPDNQTQLLRDLAAANPNLVVVLANGSAVRVSTWDGHARAILECWLSGQAAGGAVADLLYGLVNPSGRLAETIPLRLEDSPAYLNFPGEAGHVRYGEGIFVGYRGHDATRDEVSYPFGHGLSYTTFAYTGLDATIAGSAWDGDLSITVSCTVTNTGGRRGKEVVQLYVGDVEAQVARPVRELRNSVKVDLEPGASESVTFTLDERDLSYWSTAEHRWLLEPGAFHLELGASSRDIRLRTTVDVVAPAPRVRLDAMATLQEWLTHPDGSAAIRQAIGTGPDGTPGGILGDRERLTVLGNFPLSSLATFPGLGITNATIHDLLRSLPAGVPAGRPATGQDAELNSNVPEPTL
jgi:beta-glucosidase